MLSEASAKYPATDYNELALALELRMLPGVSPKCYERHRPRGRLLYNKQLNPTRAGFEM